jgi:hypothetical protein
VVVILPTQVYNNNGDSFIIFSHGYRMRGGWEQGASNDVGNSALTEFPGRVRNLEQTACFLGQLNETDSSHESLDCGLISRALLTSGGKTRESQKCHLSRMGEEPTLPVEAFTFAFVIRLWPERHMGVP